MSKSEENVTLCLLLNKKLQSVEIVAFSHIFIFLYKSVLIWRKYNFYHISKSKCINIIFFIFINKNAKYGGNVFTFFKMKKFKSEENLIYLPISI